MHIHPNMNSTWRQTPQKTSQSKRTVPPMPPVLATAFAAQSPPISHTSRPMLASAFGSRQNNLSSPSLNYYDMAEAQDDMSYVNAELDTRSSSPTVVGSSPPPTNLKPFYSLAQLSPPLPSAQSRLPHLAKDRVASCSKREPNWTRRLDSSSLENQSSRRVETPPRQSLSHSQHKDTYNFRDKSDPDEEWSSLPSRKRPALSKAPVKRTGAFRLPIPTTAAGKPVTARVRTFVPPPMARK